MITCYVRYELDLDQLDAFRRYAELWIRLIDRLGGTHHGYFLPSNDERARDHGRFSFPGMGSEGPTDVAVAVFSFPDWATYEVYRRDAGNHAECAEATRIVEETKCFTRYERNFMTPVLGPMIPQPESEPDRAAIADVVEQYAARWDAKDAEGFAALFTEDVVFETEVSGERLPHARVEGRAAILAYARKSHAGRLAGIDTRHHMTELVILALEGDRATTENRVRVTHQSEGDAEPRLRVTGTYRNQWRRTSQGWLIAERILAVDEPSRP